MKLGLISDTHNNLANLRAALEHLRAAGVEEVLHLGDVTDPQTLAPLAGLRVHHVVGNGDFASGEIAFTLQKLNAESTSGMVYATEIEGVRIAAAHGHVEGMVEGLVRSGEHDLVFHGHSHRRKDEQVNGVRVINPGALGGLRAGSRSCAWIELPAGEVRWFLLD